nr:hypothetical protein [Paraburkholderia piptadeniae]
MSPAPRSGSRHPTFAFVARISILGGDGATTSLGDLGHFANRESAFASAARCGTAFVDEELLPKPYRT